MTGTLHAMDGGGASAGATIVVCSTSLHAYSHLQRKEVQ